MGACVVLRFGRFHRLAGPGLYVTVPVVDSVTIVIDQRISSISCSAEQVLTADLVPVDLDAVVFWMVWDPKKACLAVEDYEHSASLVRRRRCATPSARWRSPSCPCSARISTTN